MAMDIASLTGPKRAAFIALVAARVAPGFGVDAGTVQTLEQQYRDKLARAKLAELNQALAFNSDPVLAQLVGNFRADDPGLVTTYAIYTRRSAAVKAESEATVRAALGIEAGTDLSGMEAEAATALSVAKLSQACGLDANVTQTRLAQYQTLIAECRRAKLSAALAANDDPVLARLVGNFRSDDPGLVNAFTVYTQRAALVKTDSVATVKEALEISGTGALTGIANDAAIALSVAKLAQACGLDANVAQANMQEFTALVAEYRKVKLNTALASNSDAVLALLVANFRNDDAGLANAFTVYTQRATTVKAEATATVKDELGITGNSALTGVAAEAATALAVAKLAQACGLDANVTQTRLAQYQAALQTYRKNALNTALAANADPVLAQLVANFRNDDAGLLNAFTVYTQRAANVKSDSDATIRELLGITGSAALTGAKKDASTALSVAKLAEACGMDANFVQLKMQESNALVTEVRRNAAETDIAAGENSTGEMKKCCDEVRATLEIANGTALDKIALAAAAALCQTRTAARNGYDANYIQLKEQEYAARIQEWRKIALNKSLATNTDPVLAQLVANFKSGDDGLLNAYAVYTQRVEAVKADAYGEIERIHDWQWIDSTWTAQTPLTTKIAAMDGLTKAAHIALCAKYLAAACGMAPEMVNVYEQHYRARLKAARTADLESTSVTDPVDAEVLALVRGAFASEAALPRSMKSLTDKIDRLKEIARKEVLSSHDWSFAEAEMLCEGAWQDGDKAFPFVATLPKGCLVVSAVYGTDGKVAQWKVRGREVRAAQQITRIVYVKDLEDYAAWHPKAYRAFILRLAADTAKAVAEKPSERQLQEQLYRDALEDAKACDAKGVNTPDEAWGENEIADTMLYGGGRSRHFDGLFVG